MNSSKIIAAIAITFGIIFGIKIIKSNKKDTGRVFVENIGGDISSLNPHIFDDYVSWRVSSDIYEGLVEYNNEGKIVLAGAKSYEMSEDKKTYTFHLRENAKWANGDPVTADDYVYSLRRAVNPKTLGTAYLTNLFPIKNAEKITKGELSTKNLGVYAVDKYTLKIELENPNFEFIDYLTLPIYLPIHKATVEKYGQNSFSNIESIMGNGPYKIASWTKNSNIVLEKNTNYWNGKNISIKKVKFLMIEDGVTDLNTFRTRTEHISSVNIPMLTEEEYRKEFGNEYKKGEVLCQLRLIFNHRNEKLKNINVRKAITIAIDRDSINKYVLKGATNGYTIIHENVYGNEFKNDINNYKELEWINWTNEERQKLALELLRNEGYSVNKPLEITILTNNNTLFKNVTTAIQDNFKIFFKGLVNCKVEFTDWKTYLANMDKGNYEIMNTRWIADYNLPSNFSMLYISNSQIGNMKYTNQVFDENYNESLNASDKYGYIDKQHTCNKIATCEYAAAPYSLTFSHRLVSDEIEGYENNVLLRHSTKYIKFKEK